MPTYGYKCDVCGVRFERFQHFSEEPVRICPECGGSVRRVIHPVGIVFKGSGWYVNDSRSASSTALPAKKGEDGEPAAPIVDKDRPADKDKPKDKDKPQDKFKAKASESAS